MAKHRKVPGDPNVNRAVSHRQEKQPGQHVEKTKHTSMRPYRFRNSLRPVADGFATHHDKLTRKTTRKRVTKL